MNKSNPPRIKIGLVFLLLLLIWWFIPAIIGNAYRIYPTERFLLFHTMAEIVSTIVCFSLFSIAWYASRQKEDLPGLIFGCFFLIVGTLETLHWLSYPGMPHLITQNTLDRASWYLVFARYTAAIALLGLNFIPRRHYPRLLRRGIFAVSLLIILLLILLVGYRTELLPVILTPTEMQTPLKYMLEYILLSIYSITLLIVWHIYDERSEINQAMLIYALEALIFSQIAFALHKSVADPLYFLAHIYKIMGYSILYRALFVSAIQKPYQELERVEETYKNLFESANDLIYFLDDQKHILNVNAKGLELLEVTREEVIGKTFDFLIDDEDLPKAQEAYWRTLKGRNVNLELRLKTKHAGIKHFIFSGLPWYKQGRVIGSQGIARDITERIEMEHQLIQTEKLSLLGKLAASVAHEVNNPLWHMQLELEELQDQVRNDPAILQSLMALDKEITRLAGIVRQLQTFARPDFKKKGEVQLNDLLQSDIIKIAFKHMRNKGVKIEKSLQPDLPPVMGSEDQITQVLLNIIKNADEVLEEGGRVKIASLADNEMVHVKISDNGPGISPENMKRIFEPFFTTKGKHGTGLGLAISSKIIEGHEGRITCESQPGQGSTFTVSLPIHKTAVASGVNS